ncbi:MAG TPA: hypothetical protein VJ770_28150 [Stellaceae bacterium]|nr:hypothetical protein [Stellaceae bacterium]
MTEGELVERPKQLFQPQLEAVTEILAGHQTALVALIAKLAERHVLSFADSKAAIADVIRLLNDKNATSGQGTVLRQILSAIAIFERQAAKIH